MKKFQLKRTDTNEIIGYFDSKIDAANEMADIIITHNNDLYEDDDHYLTPFNFECSEVEEVNEVISDYENAINYTGCVLNNIIIVNPNYAKALEALNALLTIAEAWNKADGFVPDYDDPKQGKWYPCFEKTSVGFVYAYANVTDMSKNVNSGSRICLKSGERARQFGEQFIELWNNVLL